MAAQRAVEDSPLQRDVGSTSCAAGLSCCGSTAAAAASGGGWLISPPAGISVRAAPSSTAADEGGHEGSVAASGGAVAPAAGLFALESLCSGALRRFMMVVTRTAFCRRTHGHTWNFQNSFHSFQNAVQCVKK